MKKKDIDTLIKTITIDGALDAIKQLEDSLGEQDSALVKWKSYNNQIVVGGKNHFYKIYEESKDSVGPFNSFVRNCLAKIYQDLGIDWKIVTFERDGHIFDFEQRQPLDVFAPGDVAFTDVLLSFSKILDELEDMLEFDVILQQLKEYDSFLGVQALKLLRFCVNKHIDYATFNGQVVLLDNADWMILLLDENGDVVVVDPSVSVPVKTSYGEFIFTSALYSKMVDGKNEFVVPKFNESTHGWYLQSNPDLPAQGAEIVLDKKNDKSFFDKKTSAVQFAVELEVGECASESRETNCDDEVVEIEQDLTQPCENEFYSQLETLTRSDKQICLKTKFVLGQKNEDTWKFHMENISIVYPNVRKITLVELTQENCMKYATNKFKFSKFSQDYSTEVCLKASCGHAPDRKTFAKFLRELQKRDTREYEKVIAERIYLR